MTTPLSHTSDDFYPLATETIMLTDISSQWARRVCRDITDADEQWYSFLRALAIAGFEQWLNQGSTQLPITYPQDAAPNREATIQVGDFHLCILPVGTLKDDRVTIPGTAVVGEQAAHLYVLVEVHEEVEQVRVATALRHDQLKAYIEQQRRAEEYAVPIQQFTVPPEKLLWYLSCLNPQAIIPVEILEQDQATISSQLQGAAAKVINTGKWLQGQLDTVAEQLAWQLIPSLEPSYGLRNFKDGENPQEKILDILEELQHRGVEVPAHGTGACQAVTLGQIACELYTLVWELPETQEWTLFILLGPRTDEPLPAGLALQVSDEHTVLSKSEVRQDTATTYLYIQAIGNLHEQFTVEISASDRETLTLPPFRFEPEA